MKDLRQLLVPVLLPMATAWVRSQERRILADGWPLDEAELRDAVSIGVRETNRIRILHVPRIPFPLPQLMKSLDRITGMRIEQTAGLTARYGIFIRADFRGDRRLLAHELAHTRQYERFGGIRPFLRQYLRECLTTGYAAANLEIEANAAAHEILMRP
ncbi:MAG: hypothetical protein ABI680_14565 [Chthoniobacteraceae bacterium]